MKILKNIQKNKQKELINKSQMDNQTKFYWELLEENKKLKKENEILKKEGKNYERTKGING